MWQIKIFATENCPRRRETIHKIGNIFDVMAKSPIFCSCQIKIARVDGHGRTQANK